MTEAEIMKLAREVRNDIARTEERSISLDALRRTCIGMTHDVYRAVDEAAQEMLPVQERGRASMPREFCGYPIQIIKTTSDAPGVWIMRAVELPFLRNREETDTE